jgi:hypothetical protein
MASAESAVAVARQDGAPSDINAGRHLRLAEQQLALAKQRAGVQDNRGAALMLARAHADAELSLALSRRAKNTAEATEAEQALEQARSTPGAAPAGETPPSSGRTPGTGPLSNPAPSGAATAPAPSGTSSQTSAPAGGPVPPTPQP